MQIQFAGKEIIYKIKFFLAAVFLKLFGVNSFHLIAFKHLIRIRKENFVNLK